jgi:hypothetical protein
VNGEATKNIMLHYPRHLTEKPVISDLIKRYDLTVNISRARIDPDEEGTLVMEISGLRENVEAGLGFLRDLGITYKLVSKIDRAVMQVAFFKDRCIACGLCVPACPYQAMEMSE